MLTAVETPSSLLEMALQYEKWGLSVIPLRPRGKKPLVDWETYQRRRATPIEIQAWWAKYPEANVGIVTGKISNLAVIDVDVEKGGDPSLREQFPSATVVQTGRGFHLYYRYPEFGRVANSAGKLGEGIDTRGDGGYVVAPPSIHETGVLYHFITQGELTPIPIEFVKEEEKVVPIDRHERTQGKKDFWITGLLESGAKMGERNDSCARLAGYFAGQGIAYDVALFVLKEWNRKNNPPLGESEITITARSIYQGHASRKKTQSNLPTEFATIPLSEFGAKYGEANIKWCADKWLPEGTIAFIIAAPSSYKTWLTFDLAVSVATGLPFLGGVPMSAPGPVVIMQQEDDHRQTFSRISTIVASRTNNALQPVLPDSELLSTDDFAVNVVPDIPIFLYPDRQFRFDNAELMINFARYIRATRPKLVILDPLYSATSTEDYMAKAAEQMFIFKSLRDECGTSFLIAHHTKKATEGHSRTNIWGSQFLNAFLETGWQISRATSKDSVVVTRHFKMTGDMPEVLLHFDIQTDHPSHYKIDTKEGEFSSGAEILAVLETLGSMTTTALAKELKVPRASLYPIIKALEDAGTVGRDGGKIVLFGAEGAKDEALPEF